MDTVDYIEKKLYKVHRYYPFPLRLDDPIFFILRLWSKILGTMEIHVPKDALIENDAIFLTFLIIN